MSGFNGSTFSSGGALPSRNDKIMTTAQASIGIPKKMTMAKLPSPFGL
jgi:hypothetical protein